MENLITKAYAEKAEDGVIEASVASSGIIDRQGERIDPEGWDLRNFKKNAPLLWGHNAREYRPPIGKVSKIWFDGEGKKKRLMFKTVFDMADDFAKEIWRKYKEGFLNAFSVGFRPLDVDGNTYTKAELLEISAVAVPANPDAIVVLRDAGMGQIKWEDLITKQNEEDKPTEEEKPKQDEQENTEDPEAIDEEHVAKLLNEIKSDYVKGAD